MIKKPNQQNSQKNDQQTKKESPGIEKRGYFETLREHDNSSLINIMQQINSDKDKKK